MCDRALTGYNCTDRKAISPTLFEAILSAQSVLRKGQAITSTPRLLADLSNPYRYQIQTSDPDHDPLTYQLISGPQGMTVDPLTGLTQWQNLIAGTYQVVVGAVDNHGLGATPIRAWKG